METRMTQEDRFRISTRQGCNYIDIEGMANEQGIKVIGHPLANYIEVRQKNSQICTFYFRNKRAKKDMDLGWWEDAVVVFAINVVLQD